MKKTYTSPQISVSTIDIENSICNTSSTIQIGNTDADYQQEWDELEDDQRFIQW